MFYKRVSLRRYFEDPNPEGNPKPDPKPGTFTQEQLNNILAKEKGTWQAKLTELDAKYKQLMEEKGLTDEEKTRLIKEIDTVRNSSKSKEELLTGEIEKLRKDADKKLKAASEEKEAWRRRYTDLRVEAAIIEAASTGQAYNPKQVLNLLKPQSKIQEVLDKDGKPTGDFEIKVDVQDVKDGKSVMLTLSPEDAIKVMRNNKDNANLFKDISKNGFNGENQSGGGPTGAIPTDPGEYRKQRDALKKEGKI